MSDDFSGWDAAYVLGSLSASERLEFERHLVTCDVCASAVAELAGMPGLLSKLGAAEAANLPDSTPPMPVPATLLPRLVRSAQRRQRRVRALVAGGVVAAAAAAAVILLAVPLVFSGMSNGGAPNGRTSNGGTGAVTSGTVVSLGQVVPSPLSASIRLTPEGWGTRLEMDCRYGPLPTDGGYAPGGGSASVYALYVTDASGNATEVATWSAGPGSRAKPSGSTSLSLSQIRSIDVRSIAGDVLLKGAP